MSSRRRLVSVWPRLLLAVSVVVGPLAAVGAGAPIGAWRGADAPLQAHVQLKHAAVVVGDKLSAVAHHAAHRLPGHLTADSAAVLGVLVWLAVAASTLRARRSPRSLPSGTRSRAPPERMALVVPFGPVPGSAGHFARSHHAHFRGTAAAATC
jgi:hypothetical protein